MIPPEPAAALLAHARAGVRAAARGDPAPRPPALEQAAAGVFVTLTLDGELRGCIGHLDHDRPLADAVGAAARSAACHDPRFPRLSVEEAEQVAVELSVLSPLEPVRPQQVEPGRHGVLLRRRGRQGVFLPRVATDQGWDRDRLLAELCHKAQVPRAALAEPGLELFVFECQVVSDEDP